MNGRANIYDLMLFPVPSKQVLLHPIACSTLSARRLFLFGCALFIALWMRDERAHITMFRSEKATEESERAKDPIIVKIPIFLQICFPL